MASPLIVGFGIFLAAAVGVQLGFAWRYLRSRTRGTSEDSFEKDVEWQLQYELHDAIEASSKSSTAVPNEKDESQPLLSSMADLVHRVHYGDLHHPPGSCVELRSQYRSEHDSIKQDELAVDFTEPPFAGDGMRISKPMHRNGSAGIDYSWIEESVKNDSPTFVNPKQFHRIVKRRLAREWIVKYFESRKTPMQRPRARAESH